MDFVSIWLRRMADAIDRRVDRMRRDVPTAPESELTRLQRQVEEDLKGPLRWISRWGE